MTAFSQSFSLTSSSVVLAKPTGITAHSTAPKQLSIAWTPDPNAGSVPIHYTVYLSTTGINGAFNAVGTNLTSPSFTTTVA